MILLNNGADSRLNDDSGQSPIDVGKCTATSPAHYEQLRYCLLVVTRKCG